MFVRLLNLFVSPWWIRVHKEVEKGDFPMRYGMRCSAPQRFQQFENRIIQQAATVTSNNLLVTLKLTWPVRSPDLSHIEHVWHLIGRRMGLFPGFTNIFPEVAKNVLRWSCPLSWNYILISRNANLFITNKINALLLLKCVFC